MKKGKSSRKNIKSVETNGKTTKPPLDKSEKGGSSLWGEAGKAIFKGSLFGISKEASSGYWEKIEETGTSWIEWLSQFF